MTVGGFIRLCHEEKGHRGRGRPTVSRAAIAVESHSSGLSRRRRRFARTVKAAQRPFAAPTAVRAVRESLPTASRGASDGSARSSHERKTNFCGRHRLPASWVGGGGFPGRIGVFLFLCSTSTQSPVSTGSGKSASRPFTT
jgi:hypothetical protein